MEHIVSHQSYATCSDTDDFDFKASLFITADSDLGDCNAISKEDPYLLTWDNAPNPQANPLTWPDWQRWATTVVVSAYSLISPITSSILAPSLRDIAKDFHMSTEIEMQMCMSIFVLGYAIGPLILSPLSEVFGRKWVLQCGNLWFLVFNIGCIFASSTPQMLILRLFAGIGGGAPLGIGGGILSDVWTKEERGKAVGIYVLAPLIGPAIGPVAGGFIARYSTWRWGFIATSIADAILQIASFFCLRETFSPVLLERQAAQKRKETGNEEWHSSAAFRRGATFDNDAFEVLRKALLTAWLRPLKLLVFQPTIQVMSCFMAYNYGLMYLFLSSFSELWQVKYKEPSDISGLNFISLALGMIAGAQVAVHGQPRIYTYLKQKNNDDGKPEYRLPLLMFGAVFSPIGILIYAWTAQNQTFWIGPDIGVAVFGFGIVMSMICTSGYMIECFPQVAASAVAAATCLRSIAGFGLALCAPYLFQSLGYGWGGTLLAGVAVGFGIPAPVFLWKYGQQIREKGDPRVTQR